MTHLPEDPRHDKRSISPWRQELPDYEFRNHCPSSPAAQTIRLEEGKNKRHL